MKWISREDLGWPPTAAPVQISNPRGVKIHYEGDYTPVVTHDKCAGRWTAIRNSHLANKAEGYSDVAYNLAVCRHGYVLQGRGAGYRTGANGNQSLNAEHYAVLVMIGSEGDVNPTPEAVAATKEAILYLRTHEKPAGREIKGHRDGYATSCPGGQLYELVGHGLLEPDRPAPIEEDEDMAFTDEVRDLWNGMLWGLKNDSEANREEQAKQTKILEAIAEKLGATVK